MLTVGHFNVKFHVKEVLVGTCEHFKRTLMLFKIFSNLWVGEKSLQYFLFDSGESTAAAYHCLFWRPICQCREIISYILDFQSITSVHRYNRSTANFLCSFHCVRKPLAFLLTNQYTGSVLDKYYFHVFIHQCFVASCLHNIHMKSKLQKVIFLILTFNTRLWFHPLCITHFVGLSCILHKEECFTKELF